MKFQTKNIYKVIDISNEESTNFEKVGRMRG